MRGSIRDIGKAFGVELNDYQHPQTGRFRGRVGQIYVPADLSGVVQGVFGLDTRNVGRPRIRRGNFRPVDIETLGLGSKKKGGPAAAPASPFPGAFFPPEVAQLYDYPTQLTGSGQNERALEGLLFGAAAISCQRFKTISKRFSEAILPRSRMLSCKVRATIPVRIRTPLPIREIPPVK